MTEQEYVCLFLRKYGIIYKHYEMKTRDFMRIELEDENKKKQQEEHDVYESYRNRSPHR